MSITTGFLIFHPMENGLYMNPLPKDIDPLTHPFYKKIYLRIMPASGGIARTIAYIYGGQGSINVFILVA